MLEDKKNSINKRALYVGCKYFHHNLNRKNHDKTRSNMLNICADNKWLLTKLSIQAIGKAYKNPIQPVQNQEKDRLLKLFIIWIMANSSDVFTIQFNWII